MKRFTIALSIFISACGGCEPSVAQPIGDEQLGTYALKQKGIFKVCSLVGYPELLEYDGTFSRFTDGGRVVFSYSARRFDGGFDGQFASFGESYTETGSGFGFPDGGTCDKCELKFRQEAVLALLSPSQGAALGDVCPTNALDGGIPVPDADAGIFAPGIGADGGFDAVRACGELVVKITGEGFCDPACYACDVRYRIAGERIR